MIIFWPVKLRKKYLLINYLEKNLFKKQWIFSEILHGLQMVYTSLNYFLKITYDLNFNSINKHNKLEGFIYQTSLCCISFVTGWGGLDPCSNQLRTPHLLTVNLPLTLDVRVKLILEEPLWFQPYMNLEPADHRSALDCSKTVMAVADWLRINSR